MSGDEGGRRLLGMELRHHKALAAVLCVLASAPIGLGLIAMLALPASAQDTTTTTTAPPSTTTLPPTTTTVPPTTTTVAPTTTTTHPTTTTTRAHPSTTTSHPTTTTTTAKSTSSSKTWGWVLLAVVIVLAILLVAFLIARTRQAGTGGRMAAHGPPGHHGSRARTRPRALANRDRRPRAALSRRRCRWTRRLRVWSERPHPRPTT